ncbi:unnamed protein product [Mytilus coruscus]|uniref:Endonuclease/exonuclease/phosphatase domain-containing protein n=1 Tax=Mytilus coruscus TaxID=42192 RepID=A0A6J8AZT3_MYTCO|nr:unnamed protein product [Mytilus coruscus]
MSALLDQAAKEARQGNLDLKHQVRHIGNYFSNSVETSAQEATYLTLQMPLTKATRQVVFINTSPRHKRTFLLKQSSALEKLGPDSTEIESDNDIKRYSQSSDHETEQQENGSESENEDANADVIEENNNKIDITLKNGIRIYQRKTPKVIRYVKYNYKTDSENFYRERLMLFYPWRNELSDLQCGHETFEKMYLTVAKLLEIKAKQYEGKVIDLEKAIEESENYCHENDQIAPATQQVEMEDAEIGPTESEQYVHFNPDRPTEHRLYDMSREVGIEARIVELTNHANRISESDYFALIRSLNKKQWEFFQHVITWVKTKHEPFYTFLTVGAGCGKSVVVRAIFQALHRHLCSIEASVKTKLLSSLPQKQSDTANLAKEVVLAIGMKYDLTANIEVTDGLTNGSTCELKLTECKTTSLRPSIIWVKFDDARIGANNRRKYSHLYGKDVEKHGLQCLTLKGHLLINIRKNSVSSSSSSRKTIHKSQGDTLHEVVVSLKSKRKGKIPHIHYVALSRVTSLTGLQILDLNKETIAVVECVQQELHRLRTDATLQLCFKPLYNLSSNYFKVVFNNSRSLHAHFNDLKSDPNILDADVIGIAESRLISTDENDDFHVPGFEPPVRLDQKQTNFNTRPPHGLVLYYRNDRILHNTVTFSTLSLEFVIADIISPSKGLFQVVFVYKAPNCKLQQLKDTFLADLLPDVYLRHPKIIIMGDFNIDLNTGNTSF